MKISLTARNKYKLDEQFFTTKEGYVTIKQIHLVRLFVNLLNEKKDLVNYPELAVRASEINAIGLLNEISHEILNLYKEEKSPELYKELLGELDEEFGEKAVNESLERLVDDFPPNIVYSQQVKSEEYLHDKSEGSSNREIIVQELVHLWLMNSNPSFSKHSELFDDQSLRSKTNYPLIINKIQEFFLKKESFGPESVSVTQLLETPAKRYPHSIKDQLQYVAKNWGSLLDSNYYYRILYALDIFAEEEKMRGLGPGESQVYEYEGLEERYTPDKDWMPNVLMMAKNAFVWLDQLSKKYQRMVVHLDQIPSEELIQLANWGFNALWLIGLWERSPASKKVKQWCGNPEAEASAYSLFDYTIANDLGGEESYNKLKERASKYGIRLASDMVPNHTGIDSKWIREHPDWFISVDYPPFPAYQYTGESLSGDQNFGIYLEDHYFSRTDAAVTFKHVDFRTGKTRYIYHGNDGTSMPWNDTAQLNFLIPEVREAVIQTILHVARKFSIIRFDAAMTLARKHIQRLWFPTPGGGGDIPSRAGMGLTHEEFLKAMPQEFWREVVDRINKEMPDTLLLAEAFWLLEGFFVRTLGMHRVYNSAFMNMLRDEDNAKYRSVMKNTIEFDPQILKRFVNFMSNPDEETAAKGFGKGEKYFGICLLLVTLPGLPMFGHGMIEGFQEKYGMEYRRAYLDEQVDDGLVRHHERVIFPLMKKRYLYSDVKNFLLYDLFTSEGYVDENVFCYSNGVNEERSLIVYNNFFGQTSGWIKTSVAFLDKEKGNLVQRTLTEGLNLKDA
ncbi:MAG: alpha-amylase, partial [Candidatus Heimdallarchaeota archaeon]|nr:alpha-amylase [Candidatus Heimdallarchaeota archaeon]